MAKEEKKKKKNKKTNKADAPKGKGSSSAQVVRKLDGSMALSKLKHVIMEKKGKGKKKVRCIVIPIKENFLFESESGGVFLNVRVNLKDGEDDFKQHGFIGQSVPSDIYKAATDEQKEEMQKTPILGGLKDWEFDSSSYNSDNAGSQGEDIDEEDDLPF